MRILYALTLAASLVAGAASARTSVDVWYQDPSIHTLKNAIALEQRIMAGNQYWKGHAADTATCATLRSVKVSCDYNTRAVLSDFLTVNDKGLFPASANTNPFCTGKPLPGRLDNCFIGHGRQNAMLAAAVRRNRSLFKNGDLSAEDVKKNWR